MDAAERRALEQALVADLQAGSTDMLVVDTLVYLQAKSAEPLIRSFIGRCADPGLRLGATAALHRLTQDQALLAPALDCFRALEARSDAYRVYVLISAFYNLAEFTGFEVDRVLETYAQHPDFLLSYNAARSQSLPRRVIRPLPGVTTSQQPGETSRSGEQGNS